MGPPSYMRSVVARNVVMRRMTVMELKTVKIHFKLSMVNSVTLQGCKIGFEVPDIDSSGLFGLAVIGFEVPEIDSSGLVGLAVLGSSRLVHLASDAFPPSLVLGVASCCGFESRRAGSSKTTRGGQVQVQALVSSSLSSSWKTSIKTIWVRFSWGCVCVWARL